MHEMSLAESALQIIEDAAHHQNFKRVRTVWMEIGKLACVEPEAMHFCFGVVVRNSVASGAQLKIIETAGQGKCMQCGTEMPMATLYEACSRCGSQALQIITGDAMRIIEMEVE